MNNQGNDNNLSSIDLNIISTIIFILASIISLILTLDEKNKIKNKKTLFTDKEALNISYYNRIVILISVLISLYVGYTNYESETNERAKYKSGLLLLASILSLIGSLIILYVSYLNKQEQSLTVSDIENPLI